MRKPNESKHIAKTKIEKITGTKKQIAQLENQRRHLVEQETIPESLIDRKATAITNNQIKAILNPTLRIYTT